MATKARITGEVLYREGDGQNLAIPEGPIEFQETDFDVTISWEDGDTRGATAIPRTEFKRYLDANAIEL